MEEASARGRRRPREGDTATSAAAYQPIANVLKVSGTRVCLFAVVAEIGPAVLSDGTDFTVTLRIVDDSRKAGVSVTFFAKDAALLPHVKSSGDVISLHNVVIKLHGEFFVTFNKMFSSFALFESKVSAGCSPYQTSEKYHGREHDKELLTQMRTWLQDNRLGLKDLELQLSSLKSDSTFDLVCKVLHVLEDNDELIFYVWDGTDSPAAEFQTILDAEEVASPPLFEGPPLSREVLCKMPCVGTVLRIFSDRDFSGRYFRAISHMRKNIYWARFWNVTCNQESGIWKGNVSGSSGVRLLSLEDGSVVDRLKMYDSRNTNKFHRRPMAHFVSNVTEVDFKTACYSTLMESLTHNEVTHNVKTLVRVVAAACRVIEVSLLLTGEYCIQLTLEDPTARIHAFVHQDGLVKFFGDPLTEEVIIKKMKKLLGIPEAEDSEEVAPLTRNPPWIWCCLKSYYEHENDPWGSRRYQISATRIRD